MNSENLSHTIYRDHNIDGRPKAGARTSSWLRLGAEDDRAERFEVLLRVLLVVCVGAAMLACGVVPNGSAAAPDRAAQCVPVIRSACAAADAVAVRSPATTVRVAQSL